MRRMDIWKVNSWRMECKVDAETKKDYLVQKTVCGGYGEQKVAVVCWYIGSLGKND